MPNKKDQRDLKQRGSKSKGDAKSRDGRKVGKPGKGGKVAKDGMKHYDDLQGDEEFPSALDEGDPNFVPETVEIIVPKGKKAGDEMIIEGHLGKFTVNVPEGMKEGDTFHIEIKEPNPEPDMVTVKVPEGMKAGDKMVIEGHLGKFNVNIPEGMKEGDEFHVEVNKDHAEPENMVTVTVPEGCKAGDTITIGGDQGKFNVEIPEGMKEGDKFNVAIEKKTNKGEKSIFPFAEK